MERHRRAWLERVWLDTGQGGRPRGGIIAGSVLVIRLWESEELVHL